MIVARLSGGLGNQMFQYAAGRALADRHHTELALDLRLYQDDPLRRFDLERFTIRASVAAPEKLEFYLDNPSLSFQVKRLIRRKMRGLPRLKLVQESGFSFYENGILPHTSRSTSLLDHAPANAYIAGLWHSQNYFAHAQAEIRQDFTLKTPPQGKNKELLTMIAASTGVSLHIRRGDYVTAPVAKSILGPLDLDYYTAAAQYITQHVTDPTFFVFSDDTTWCKQNLKLTGRVVFVDHNSPEDGAEDLRLMAACQHNIIANSSFSWWGAWLGEHPSKLVIGPKNWFHDPAYDASDMLPKEWIIL